MAESGQEGSNKFDALGFRRLSGSLFSIPGFFVGFGSKSSSESDLVRSPTSPLDFKGFSYGRNHVSSKVGLCIVDSLVDETESSEIDILSPRKNIIIGPQVKIKIPDSSTRYSGILDSSIRSNSLPRNYVASSLARVGVSRFLDSKSDSTFSVASSSQDPYSGSEKVCSDDGNRSKSTPLVIGKVSEVDNSMASSSLPATNVSGRALLGSLSTREIELSEDYTCIISHGPNPKTIRIFGDCILECCTDELTNFNKKEDYKTGPSQVAEQSDEVLPNCYLCGKKMRAAKNNCTCRDEILSEEDGENSFINSSKSSVSSSYNEDLFLMGMPFTE